MLLDPIPPPPPLPLLEIFISNDEVVPLLLFDELLLVLNVANGVPLPLVFILIVCECVLCLVLL